MPEIVEREEGGTKYLSLEDAFTIGGQIEFLKRVAKNEHPLYIPDSEGDPIEVLNTLISDLRRAEIDSSAISAIEDCHQDFVDIFGPLGNERITADEDFYQRLAESCNNWRNQLHYELEKAQRVPVKSTGLIDAEELDDNPEILFNNGNVWEELTPATKSDLEESAKALTFDLPTAATTMSLRALERRLQDWHRLRNGEDDSDRTFGQLTSEIEDDFESADETTPAIISHLEYLRQRRNQVAHTQRNPTLQEAESTLVMVRETLTEIHYRLEADRRTEGEG